MKAFITTVAATMLLISSASFASSDFPGLDDTLKNPHLLGPEITVQELRDQIKHRENLEHFAKELKAWWWSENHPKPTPYIEVKGHKIKLHKKFIEAYLKAKKKKDLKKTWKKIEKNLKVS